MKTQAAILVSSKQDLIIDEIEINNLLEEGQVLVKIEKSGICGAQINEIDAVKGVDGVATLERELVCDPPCGPDMFPEETKFALGWD